MALLTVSQLKDFLEIPASDTSRDGKLAIIVAGVVAQILNDCDLATDVSSSYEDRIRIDDPDTDTLMLRAHPVIAITSVVANGVTLTAAEYKVSPGGGLRLVDDGAWYPIGRDSVVVTYTAGYAAGAPGDLLMAACLIGAYAWNTGPRAGLTGEKIGQYSYTMGGGGTATAVGGGGFGIPEQAERILANYRRAFALPN